MIVDLILEFHVILNMDIPRDVFQIQIFLFVFFVFFTVIKFLGFYLSDSDKMSFFPLNSITTIPFVSQEKKQENL